MTAPHGSSRGLLRVCTDAMPPHSSYVGCVQHRRGGMRCSSLANEHHVQSTLMLLPTGTIYRGTPKHHSIGKVLPTRIACWLPSGKGPFIPIPKGWAFWPCKVTTESWISHTHEWLMQSLALESKHRRIRKDVSHRLSAYPNMAWRDRHHCVR